MHLASRIVRAKRGEDGLYHPMFTPEEPVLLPPDPPFHPPWRLLKQIGTIVAPGGLFVAATVLFGFGNLAWVLVGTPAAWLGLIVMVSILSPHSLPRALARGVAQGVFLYLGTLLAMLLGGWPAFPQTPYVVALATIAMVLPPLAPASAMRWFGWRIARMGSGTEPELRNPAQFRLAELLLGVTLVAFALGVGLAITSRFDEKAANWEGLLLFGTLLYAILLCVPIGLVALLLTWLILCSRHKLARLIATATLFVVLFSLPSLLSYTLEIANPHIVYFVTLALLIPMIAVLLPAYFAGWRMERMRPPRSSLSASAHRHST
jgi:hypothetical protein